MEDYNEQGVKIDSLQRVRRLVDWCMHYYHIDSSTTDYTNDHIPKSYNYNVS